ncbi:hypothetical protein PARC_a0932 [Pseudoalteromonas arctica A 37-1-2]|uniref:Uncharacterized protein n=1 Tax=Pseudoalteromonas arctica A 37-1-2 TaxID=1117313 RepID=A0A290S075_9GAMM|nr:hypothetical protein PARC_a0932 [Pseudoalteromonas arctica A 37-1-2]
MYLMIVTLDFYAGKSLLLSKCLKWQNKLLTVNVFKIRES